LMSWRAVVTDMGVPSASRTAAYLEKTAMPRFGRLGGGRFYAGPASNKFVVGAGVFSLAEAFAEGVQAIGELARSFGFSTERGEERARGRFAALLQCANKLMQCYRRGKPWLGLDIIRGNS
jgi:hypothetical protein